jgi:hypothetical protein
MWWQCLRREYTVFNKQKFATFAIKFCRHLLAPQRRPHVSRLKPAEELLAGEASEVSEAFALAARSLAAAMIFSTSGETIRASRPLPGSTSEVKPNACLFCLPPWVQNHQIGSDSTFVHVSEIH